MSLYTQHSDTILKSYYMMREIFTQSERLHHFSHLIGFLDCLENPQEKGVIYGIGAWKVGEIKDTPYMQEAYEMGKMV